MVKRMNVLIACEESQEVCKAFRERGHRAFRATYWNLQEVIQNGTFWAIVSR